MNKTDAVFILKVQVLVREYAQTHPEIIAPCQAHNRLPCAQCSVGVTYEWLAWKAAEKTARAERKA